MRVMARNRLVYPTGRMPGFNPSHVALARNGQVRLSAVAGMNGFYDVMRGKPAGITGTPTAGIYGVGGPFASGLDAADHYDFSGQNNTNDLTMTLACIAHIVPGTSIPFAGPLTFFSLGDFGGWQFFCDGFGQPGIQQWGVNGGIIPNIFTYLTLGTPIFGVMSTDQVGNVTNGLFRFIPSGLTQSGTTNSTSVSFAPNSLAHIGFDGQNGARGVANVYAAAGINNVLTFAEMQEWADDPWSFWYPRKQEPDWHFIGPSGLALDQSHYRFRVDANAVDGTPAWAAAQDTAWTN